MSTSLSSLVDNLSEIYKKECKSCKERKKIMSELIFIGLKNNRLHYKCKQCNDESFKSINGLNKKVPNTYQFCDVDVKKFVLLLRKGIYSYEYMDSWDTFNKTLVPDKETFYSKRNKEGITNEDYPHAQKVLKEFALKNIGEYHGLYVQSDTLLLADVFENFRDKCIEIYELDPTHFLSVPKLAWQAYLKNTGVKLELLTDYDMLMMFGKVIRGGIFQAIYRYAKAKTTCRRY